MADLQIAPLKIVGYEGLFGMIAMIGVLLPIVQRVPGQDGSGIHEDTIDTLRVCKTTATEPVLIKIAPLFLASPVIQCRDPHISNKLSLLLSHLEFSAS